MIKNKSDGVDCGCQCGDDYSSNEREMMQSNDRLDSTIAKNVILFAAVIDLLSIFFLLLIVCLLFAISLWLAVLLLRLGSSSHTIARLLFNFNFFRRNWWFHKCFDGYDHNVRRLMPIIIIIIIIAIKIEVVWLSEKFLLKCLGVKCSVVKWSEISVSWLISSVINDHHRTRSVWKYDNNL